MIIEKIRVKNTLKFGENVYQQGEVHNAPFPDLIRKELSSGGEKNIEILASRSEEPPVVEEVKEELPAETPPQDIEDSEKVMVAHPPEEDPEEVEKEKEETPIPPEKKKETKTKSRLRK